MPAAEATANPPALWLTTLVCTNQVDSEKLVVMLSEAGYRWAKSPDTADVVMVNTCAFIEDARAESVETILELEGAKREGARSVVLGCMAQRFGEEVADALPEVDAVVALDRYGELVGILDDLTRWSPIRLRRRPVMDIPHATGRPVSGLPYAYLKVAEGCNKPCSFCAIPAIRGRQRSRRPVEIREELVGLVAGGVSEVILVAQDLAAYGRDMSSVQEEITLANNEAWLDQPDLALVDMVEDGVPIGRSHRHAPEIDGVNGLDRGGSGDWVPITYTGVYGTDMEAVVG